MWEKVRKPSLKMSYLTEFWNRTNNYILKEGLEEYSSKERRNSRRKILEARKSMTSQGTENCLCWLECDMRSGKDEAHAEGKIEGVKPRPGGISSSLLTKSGLKPLDLWVSFTKDNHACVLMCVPWPFLQQQQNWEALSETLSSSEPKISSVWPPFC